MEISHTDKGIRITSVHEGTVAPIRLSHLGQRFTLLSAGSKELCCWEAATGELKWRDPGNAPGIEDLAVVGTPDGRYLVVAAAEDGIYCWDARNGAPIAETDALKSQTIWSVATAPLPDGRSAIIGAGNEALVYRWDAVTGEPLGPPLSGRRDSVKAVTALAELVGVMSSWRSPGVLPYPVAAMRPNRWRRSWSYGAEHALLTRCGAAVA